MSVLRASVTVRGSGSGWVLATTCWHELKLGGSCLEEGVSGEKLCLDERS